MSKNGIVSPSEQVEDFLAHYGVKGMRWGVRKLDNGNRTKVRPKRASYDDIRSARRRQTARESAIEEARDRIKAAPKGSAAASKAGEAHQKAVSEYLNSPDRVTANRLLKGEKVALGVLAAFGGPIGVAAVGAGVGVNRRATDNIARQQARGGYEVYRKK